MPLPENCCSTLFNTGFKRLTEGGHWAFALRLLLSLEAFCFGSFCFEDFAFGFFGVGGFWKGKGLLKGRRLLKGKELLKGNC
jgi:hypothetical protein